MNANLSILKHIYIQEKSDVFSTCYFANILPFHNQRSIFIAF